MCWSAPAVPDWPRLGWALVILSDHSRAINVFEQTGMLTDK